MGSGKKVSLTYKGETREFEPWEISREILKSLVAEAKKGIYKDINDVVITVPAYFTNTQIEETKKTAETAGLSILSIQKEPVAAALIYNQDNREDIRNKHILLYDLGGGTFDVSLVMISKQEDSELDDIYGLSSGEDKVLFSVLKVLGDMKLGGDDSINILDCLAMNIGVLSEGYISTVLKAGDQIPCSNYKTFLTEEEGQDAADLEIFQRLTRYPEECTRLGTLPLSNLGTKKNKVGKIYLVLSVDSNGLLSIEAESGKSGLQRLDLINVMGN